jgi:Putative transposase
VRVLSRVFRGKFLSYLRDAYDSGELRLRGKLEHLTKKSAWIDLVRSLSRMEWVVYSKPPFGGPKQVLKYLARYTHRVAISDQRLVASEDGRVTFRYKDYRTGGIERTMTLEGTEFLRRFLQHVLPRSFHRIRYFGFLSNRHRAEKIALAKALLGQGREDCESQLEAAAPAPEASDAAELKGALCPVCKKGRLIVIEDVVPDPRILRTFLTVTSPDTS